MEPQWLGYRRRTVRRIYLCQKKWRTVLQTANPIVYLPFNEDTFDPSFVSDGTEFLLATARRAIEELRLARAPGVAYPGKLLADIVPAEVIATLAVIEQTDDADFVTKRAAAFNEVLSQYGLKREEAYRYSVSSAAALGPMQFTNKKGKGTYALVVKRCPEARLDPNFERGATNLLNAMKAAICLFDIELSQMRADISLAYRDNMKVLGIFPVAAYNGGPRNVAKLYAVIRRMGVDLEDLRLPGTKEHGSLFEPGGTFSSAGLFGFFRAAGPCCEDTVCERDPGRSLRRVDQLGLSSPNPLCLGPHL